MVQVEMSNMYIDMGVNNGSEKWTGKNTAKWEVACTVFSILNSVMCTMLVDIVIKPSFKDMEGQLNTEKNWLIFPLRSGAVWLVTLSCDKCL